ncbi:aryl-sulfate sulfohydrolase [Fulvitalea axinellae]|uniref:Aryl-sulfate sulfohydrolase n=1 Tax=Fulvitalea axinellae TaxID=1182444 RepID=A0AAU9CIW8_9BACT|nr:aryl-sulfate sulfohydrolase [Fulvitalea axinellae]
MFSNTFCRSKKMLAAGLLFLLTVKQGSLRAESDPSRPNIVFILLDDMGRNDLGFLGSDFYETPNIDKLASEGMFFSNAYANAPNCAPSRASIVTGQYTPRHGILTVNSSERGDASKRKIVPIPNKKSLRKDAVTIAQAMRNAGYETGQVGKWHVGKDPLTQGFDFNAGGSHRGSPSTYYSPYRLSHLEDGPKGEYLTDRLTDEAIGFIKKKRDKPFFLYLSQYAVHTPIHPPKNLISKYKAKKKGEIHKHPGYAAMVENADMNIGRVLKVLKDQGMEENTMVIFFSDNGGHGVYTDMSPMRGSKGMLYEGGVKEPLIVKWPKHIKKGSRCDTPVMGADFFPTMLASAGVSLKKYDIDGVDLSPLLKQKGKIEKRALYWHFPVYLQGYKKGMNFRTTPAASVRYGDYKLIEFFEDGKLELYNLRQDEGEKYNLAEAKPKMVRKMSKMMRDWRKKVRARVPTKPNPLYKGDI